MEHTLDKGKVHHKWDKRNAPAIEIESGDTVHCETAEVTNNQGWSELLRGDWTKAAERFEKAATRDPKSSRIANNLELARAALASDLPKRRPGEDDRAWAARLNDAGVAALLLGDKQRAVAAFAQALEASGSWYDRAANNLKAANSR